MLIFPAQTPILAQNEGGWQRGRSYMLLICFPSAWEPILGSPPFPGFDPYGCDARNHRKPGEVLRTTRNN